MRVFKCLLAAAMTSALILMSPGVGDYYAWAAVGRVMIAARTGKAPPRLELEGLSPRQPQITVPAQSPLRPETHSGDLRARLSRRILRFAGNPNPAAALKQLSVELAEPANGNVELEAGKVAGEVMLRLIADPELRGSGQTNRFLSALGADNLTAVYNVSRVLQADTEARNLLAEIVRGRFGAQQEGSARALNRVITRSQRLFDGLKSGAPEFADRNGQRAVATGGLGRPPAKAYGRLPALAPAGTLITLAAPRSRSYPQGVEIYFSGPERQAVPMPSRVEIQTRIPATKRPWWLLIGNNEIIVGAATALMLLPSFALLPYYDYLSTIRHNEYGAPLLISAVAVALSLLPSLTSLRIHNLGHYFFAKWAGAGVPETFKAYMKKYPDPPLNPHNKRQHFWGLLGGPVWNIAFGLGGYAILWVLMYVFGSGAGMPDGNALSLLVLVPAFAFSWINLTMGLGALIPVRLGHGGHKLLELWREMRKER